MIQTKKHQFLSKLKQDYPQFKSFESLFDYYTDYQFPETQAHIFRFWKQILKYTNRYFNTITLKQSEVIDLFTIHTLQPKPAITILRVLHERGEVFGLSQAAFVYEEETEEKLEARRREKAKEPEPGMLKKVFGFFAGFTKKVEPKALEDEVFFKDVADSKLGEMCSFLNREVFKDTCIHQTNYVLEKITSVQHQFPQFELILDILELQNIIKRVEYKSSLKSYHLTIFSGENTSMNKTLVQVQTTVFALSLHLKQLTKKIDQTLSQIREFTQKSIQMIQQGNNKLAKIIFKQKLVLEKFLAEMVDRRQIVRNTLNQLTTNNINNDILSVVKESQNLIKSTIVDLDAFEDMVMTHDQIKDQQNQVDRIYQEIAGDDGEVEKLYHHLEEEVNKQEKELAEKEKEKQRQKEREKDLDSEEWKKISEIIQAEKKGNRKIFE